MSMHHAHGGSVLDDFVNELLARHADGRRTAADLKADLVRVITAAEDGPESAESAMRAWLEDAERDAAHP